VAPHRESRPDPKPPFGGLALSSLTSMLLQPWRDLISETAYDVKQPRRSQQIIEGLVRGVDIGYTGPRDLDRTAINHSSALKPAEVRAKVTTIISANAAGGKTAGPCDTKPFAWFSVSPIGSVPKKPDEGCVQKVTDIRVIHDLSHPFGGNSINNWSEDVPLSLDGFDKAIGIVTRLGRGCFLTKLDVKAAYKLVPVRYEDWHLLGFKWEGKYYYERTLPFGLKSSCRQWEWYATAINHFLVTKVGAVDTIHYVDDYLLANKIESVALTHLADGLGVFDRLGVPIAHEKTVGPTTELTFLGVLLNTLTMTASLPPAKLRELTSLLEIVWGGKVTATRAELQSLCGKLNWAAQVVRPGRTYLRRIIDHMKHAHRRGGSARPITHDVRADIRWWREHISLSNGVSLLYEAEWTAASKIELTTDACNTGWGAAYGDRWIKNSWTDAELAASRGTNPECAIRRSMPYLEFLAILYAAATWGATWQRKRIIFHCDAEAVVYAIKNGSSRIPAIMTLVRALHALSTQYNFDVRCTHIAGVANVAADALSRDDMQAYTLARPTGNKEPDRIGSLPRLF
jgi:hypothetical protein